MKRIVFVFACWCLMVGAYAASVVFNKILLEHGTVRECVQGMTAHVTFDIPGYNGQTCKAVASFDGTGSDESRQYSGNYNGNGILGNPVKTWRENLGYGMFAINKVDNNGVRFRTIFRPCSACRGTTMCGNCYGTRACTICHGRGGIVTAGYGTYIQCVACGGTGRCGVCNGTGKCVCTNYEYPGYMPGSTIVMSPDGKVIHNSRDYDSGSSSSYSSGSSSGSSRGTCPKCGGRRYESTPYQYAAASAAGWAQPYHNAAGNSCPYCNYSTDHYHYPCSECHGFGHK